MMNPLVFNLGPMELIIILAIVLLLFGGSRLAGLGKSTGRALKEFKEETKGLKPEDGDPNKEVTGTQSTTAQPTAQQPTGQHPTGQQPPVQDPAPNDVRKDG